MGLIYYADDATLPALSAPDTSTLTRPFKVTLATMLAQPAVAAAGVLIGDVILLAPLPGGCTVTDYLVAIPELDTGSAATYDLGDNVILSGAINGTVGTAFTTAAIGTSQTITAAASTSSFTATNAVISINGVLFGYASLAGSTFVTAYASVAGVVIPAGSLIQQAGNFAAYQAVAVMQSASGINLMPWGSVSSTTLATATAVPSALPAFYSQPMNTYGTPNPAVPAQIGQRWFALKIHASPTTYNAPSVPITGYVRYQMNGGTY